jgi:ubiquinone/menaquinone biosynthesis C-methylase UbiE
MGHEGAGWLERDERASDERPDLLVEALSLRPGMTVADIGAGTGYFSWRIAQRIGPTGRVLAVDVQPEMLVLLDREMKKRRVANVKTVLGSTTDPNLPAGSVDLVVMVDVYHEFDRPREMLAALVRALKPGGRMVFVEYRAEDASVPIKPLHKMSEGQVRREAAAAGLQWMETVETLPWQHIVIFTKGR